MNSLLPIIVAFDVADYEKARKCGIQWVGQILRALPVDFVKMLYDAHGEHIFYLVKENIISKLVGGYLFDTTNTASSTHVSNLSFDRKLKDLNTACGFTDAPYYKCLLLTINTRRNKISIKSYMIKPTSKKYKHTELFTYTMNIQNAYILHGEIEKLLTVYRQYLSANRLILSENEQANLHSALDMAAEEKRYIRVGEEYFKRQTADTSPL